jgi:hypothetical protein
MTHTARITKEIHVHKPATRMLMSYTDTKGERCAKILKMGNPNDDAFLLKTLRWASHNGVEIVFRPV